MVADSIAQSALAQSLAAAGSGLPFPFRVEPWPPLQPVMMLGAVPVVAGGLPGAIPCVAPVGVVGDRLAALPGVAGQLSGFPLTCLRNSARARIDSRSASSLTHQQPARFSVLARGRRRRSFSSPVAPAALLCPLSGVVTTKPSSWRFGSVYVPSASALSFSEAAGNRNSSSGIYGRRGRLGRGPGKAASPEMPEPPEQEDLRMLAENPWAAGSDIDSG